MYCGFWLVGSKCLVKIFRADNISICSAMCTKLNRARTGEEAKKNSMAFTSSFISYLSTRPQFIHLSDDDNVIKKLCGQKQSYCCIVFFMSCACCQVHERTSETDGFRCWKYFFDRQVKFGKNEWNKRKPKKIKPRAHHCIECECILLATTRRW